MSILPQAILHIRASGYFIFRRNTSYRPKAILHVPKGTLHIANRRYFINNMQENNMKNTVSFISLGCAKNQVDCWQMT